MPKLSFLSAASNMLVAGTAYAETQLERDTRRASYIVGVSCNVLWGGNPVRLCFLRVGGASFRIMKAASISPGP